jgi:hypothetical protein
LRRVGASFKPTTGRMRCGLTDSLQVVLVAGKPCIVCHSINASACMDTMTVSSDAATNALQRQCSHTRSCIR